MVQERGGERGGNGRSNIQQFHRTQVNSVRGILLGVLEKATCGQIVLSCLQYIVLSSEGSFSSSFLESNAFQDVIDISIGWVLDSALEDSVAREVAECVAQFKRHWEKQEKFGLDLLSNFINDVGRELENSIAEEGVQSVGQQTRKKVQQEKRGSSGVKEGKSGLQGRRKEKSSRNVKGRKEGAGAGADAEADWQSTVSRFLVIFDALARGLSVIIKRELSLSPLAPEFIPTLPLPVASQTPQTYHDMVWRSIQLFTRIAVTSQKVALREGIISSQHGNVKRERISSLPLPETSAASFPYASRVSPAVTLARACLVTLARAGGEAFARYCPFALPFFFRNSWSSSRDLHSWSMDFCDFLSSCGKSKALHVALVPMFVYEKTACSLLRTCEFEENTEDRAAALNLYRLLLNSPDSPLTFTPTSTETTTAVTTTTTPATTTTPTTTTSENELNSVTFSEALWEWILQETLCCLSELLKREGHRLYSSPADTDAEESTASADLSRRWNLCEENVPNFSYKELVRLLSFNFELILSASPKQLRSANLKKLKDKVLRFATTSLKASTALTSESERARVETLRFLGLLSVLQKRSKEDCTVRYVTVLTHIY